MGAPSLHAHTLSSPVIPSHSDNSLLHYSTIFKAATFTLSQGIDFYQYICLPKDSGKSINNYTGIKRRIQAILTPVFLVAQLPVMPPRQSKNYNYIIVENSPYEDA